MIRCRYLLAAALLSTTSAFAAGNVTLTDQNNQYFGTQANPLWVTGGGGGSGGAYTGATATAPGTNGATATPVQGVDGGKVVAVTWTGQAVGITGTVQLGAGSAAIGSVSVSNFPATQAVSGTVGIAAGTAIIGKVGIDQTTPGTTNKVSIGTDGTVAATQSGAYTVTQGPAGATAWKFDGSGVTQPVSASALPLPAGAAISANQPSNAAQGSTTSGQTGTLGMGAVLGGAASYTAGQTSPFTMDGNGALMVSLNRAQFPGSIQSGAYNATLQTFGAGAGYAQLDVRGHTKTSEAGSSDPLVGITPTVTQAGTSAVGKASPGNFYSAYAVNTTTTAGYLVLINATAAPSSGAAITPVDVATLGGTVGAIATLNYGAGPPNAYSTGVVALITTSLTTYTPGGNAFIQVRAR